jgi:hypothetical protein
MGYCPHRRERQVTRGTDDGRADVVVASHYSEHCRTISDGTTHTASFLFR